MGATGNRIAIGPPFLAGRHTWDASRSHLVRTLAYSADELPGAVVASIGANS